MELQQELDTAAPEAPPPERIDQTVIAYIFGGHVVIAGRINQVAQAEAIVVAEGDQMSLVDALKHLGVTDMDELHALQNAIAEDAATASRGPGQRTLIG